MSKTSNSIIAYSMGIILFIICVILTYKYLKFRFPFISIIFISISYIMLAIHGYGFKKTDECYD